VKTNPPVKTWVYHETLRLAYIICEHLLFQPFSSTCCTFGHSQWNDPLHLLKGKPRMHRSNLTAFCLIFFWLLSDQATFHCSAKIFRSVVHDQCLSIEMFFPDFAKE
jgi:hypothetical protein